MGIRSKFQEGREYRVVFTGNDGKPIFGKQYSPRSRTVYREYSFSGAMRKYAGWHHDKLPEEITCLDAIAHRKIVPMGAHGLVVRRKAAPCS